MWIGLLVVMLASGEMQKATSPVMFKDEASCKAASAKVVDAVHADQNVKAYAIKCFEITADDVKANGQDS